MIRLVFTDILRSSKKPKEKAILISNSILRDENLVPELITCFTSGSDVDKRTCANVMKLVSQNNPALLVDYLDDLIEHINSPISRVKWGIPETIGNLAKQYPNEVMNAIPNLLRNTTDKSTVVRWCAAYALTEIAKHNAQTQQELVTTFQHIVSEEQNNGVKNVYLKCLKQLAS
jgi:hypothetical protein